MSTYKFCGGTCPQCPPGSATYVSPFVLAKIDIFIIPFFIRTLMITAKFIQMVIMDSLKRLFTGNIHDQLQQGVFSQHFLDSDFF